MPTDRPTIGLVDAVPRDATDGPSVIDIGSRRTKIATLPAATPAALIAAADNRPELRARAELLIANVDNLRVQVTPTVQALLVEAQAIASAYLGETEPEGMGDREARVLAVLTGEWQTAEAIGVACGLGYVVGDLRRLVKAGKAYGSGGEWKARP